MNFVFRKINHYVHFCNPFGLFELFIDVIKGESERSWIVHRIDDLWTLSSAFYVTDIYLSVWKKLIMILFLRNVNILPAYLVLWINITFMYISIGNYPQCSPYSHWEHTFCVSQKYFLSLVFNWSCMDYGAIEYGTKVYWGFALVCIDCTIWCTRKRAWNFKANLGISKVITYNYK